MEKIIKEYINKIDEQTIDKFAKKNDINLKEKELKVIFLYIKNYWETFYKGNPEELFNELEETIEKDNLIKIKNLYSKYKEKIIH